MLADRQAAKHHPYRLGDSGDEPTDRAAEQPSALAAENNCSGLNVRDVTEQTSAASEKAAACRSELARLEAHLQTSTYQHGRSP